MRNNQSQILKEVLDLIQTLSGMSGSRSFIDKYKLAQPLSAVTKFAEVNGLVILQ